MIVDSIQNLKKYCSLNPLFKDVVDFLESTQLVSHPQGIVKLKSDDLFANFTIAKGKKPEEARLETHNKMIDIQIPLNVAETMGYIPREKLTEGEYNAQKDITFYEESPESYVTVNKGEFAIFFPQDGHAPCISDNTEIQKVIFKVKVCD